jgi:class 3 adenylate cyclase/pimeloyl-ACP methyl ester carboxylesterase
VEPETRYALLGGDRIAYQVLGDGPVDVVACLGIFMSLDALWAYPEAAAAYRRLADHCRLIMFDQRGIGASDVVSLDVLPPLESRWDEVRAVMDAAGSERAVLFGQQEGGPPAMLGAATEPDRVSGLILFHSPARYRWADDYSIGLTEETIDQWRTWMGSWDVDAMVVNSFPSRGNDERFLHWGRKFMRAAAAPAVMRRYIEEMIDREVRDLLPAVHVPTLVIHRQDYRWIPADLDRYVADHIEGARFANVPGGDAAIYFDEVDAMIQVIRGFLAEVAPAGARTPAAERVMATVLFTDIVDSTKHAREVGDAEWVHLLQVHDDLSRQVVEQQGGRIVKSTGDGILAVLDGPGRGLLAARGLAAALGNAGLPVRVGLHTGEVELRAGDLGGVGVHIAARVMAAARPGEVLVSRTVKDLVIGSQFTFEDRGIHPLKGVQEDWQLFALVE